MFDPKKDISDIFEKGQKIIDKEIKEPIERITESEFKERVREILIKNFHDKTTFINLDEGYKTACSLVPNMQYTLEDVINLFNEFQESKEFYIKERFGIYISALINRAIKESDIVELNVKNDSRLDHYLGLFLPRGTIILNGCKVCPHDTNFSKLGYGLNGGKLIINGDYQGSIGHRMKAGTLEVRGNLSDNNYKDGPGFEMEGGLLQIDGDYKTMDRSLGVEMKGGKILVKGNVGRIGERMEDGEITVEGNAQGMIGVGMNDGKIVVEGNCKECIHGTSVGYGMCGGEIKVEGYCEANVGFYLGNGVIDLKKVIGTHNSIGYMMENGKINIKGGVEGTYHSVGTHMKEGIIRIGGSALNCDIGITMFDGKIIVEGDVSGGKYVGSDMRGGVIEVNGDMPSPNSRTKRLSGSIYHKGKEIKDSIFAVFM